MNVSNAIRVPRRIVLDTSVLNKMAQDWVPGVSQGPLGKLLERFLSHEWVLLLSGHHLIELLQHDNDEVRRKRLQLLSVLPTIGWLRSTVPGSPQHIGIMTDIHYLEAGLISGDPNLSFADVRTQLWEPIAVWLSPSQSFAKDVIDCVRRLAPGHLTYARNAATQIGGLSVVVNAYPNVGLDTVCSYGSSERRIAEVGVEYHRALVACKDKSIADTAFCEKEYADWLAQCVEQARRIGPNATLRQVLCAAFNIPASWTEKCVTSDEFAEAVAFELQMSSIFSKRDASITWQAGVVSARSMPSYVLEIGLRNAQLRSQSRASGSDLADAYSAALAFYSDTAVVDKRTREFLSQRWVDDAGLRSLLGNVLSVGDYRELLNVPV